MLTNHIKQIYRHLTATSWHLGFVVGGLDGVFLDVPLIVNWVKSPYNDRWFADPFILDVTDNNIFLLVEEVRYKYPTGRIAKLTIDKSSFEIVKNDTILELPTHLSFPNILRKNGKIYVYPENCHSGKQDIYEYNPNTEKLDFIQTICKDVIWDAVMTDRFGKCQLFTAKSNDYSLDIYDWNEAEKLFEYSNSISSNSKNMRMAGQFFEYNGNLYCPSQNCERTYGGSVEIKKIQKGGGEINFELIKTLYSPHKKYKEGLHTLNEYKGVVVIDVIGYNHPTIASFFVNLKKCLIKCKMYIQK